MHANHKMCTKKVEIQTDHDIKMIYKVFVLCGLFMLVEVWGHWTSNTLSLLADSVHLLVDLLGFAISLVALRVTKRRPDNKMTFGYGRIEIVGALFSIFLIWGVVGYLLVESYHKYKHPHKINEKIFLAISLIGFGVNLICVFLLHNARPESSLPHTNLNIRATYVHVIGDLVQSVGVLIAGAIAYVYPTFVIVDIICTVLFSVMVLFTTSVVLRDGVRILLEMVPEDVNMNLVRKKLTEIENVYDVVDLKVWSLSSNINAVNATLLVEDVYVKDYETVLRVAKNTLQCEFSFEFVTVQIETFGTYYESATGAFPAACPRPHQRIEEGVGN